MNGSKAFLDVFLNGELVAHGVNFATAGRIMGKSDFFARQVCKKETVYMGYTVRRAEKTAEEIAADEEKARRIKEARAERNRKAAEACVRRQREEARIRRRDCAMYAEKGGKLDCAALNTHTCHNCAFYKKELWPDPEPPKVSTGGGWGKQFGYTPPMENMGGWGRRFKEENNERRNNERRNTEQ